MSDCMMIGRCVGVRNYQKKDGTPACVLSVADSHGSILEFYGNNKYPEYPFGTHVSVGFDIRLFNGKPSGLNFSDVKEVKG